MTITEFFNPYSVDHMRAYDNMVNNGMWPKGFIPEGTTFPSTWQVEVFHKMADAWIKAVKYGHVKGMPDFND